MGLNEFASKHPSCSTPNKNLSPLPMPGPALGPCLVEAAFHEITGEDRSLQIRSLVSNNRIENFKLPGKQVAVNCHQLYPENQPQLHKKMDTHMVHYVHYVFQKQ